MRYDTVITHVPRHCQLAIRRPGATPALLVAMAVLAACEGPQPPAACGAGAQVTVHAKESTNVTACFNDPNGDMLSYSATSSDPSVATVSASGPNVTITAVLPGSASVTVTAVDPGGLQGQQRFPVTVPNRPPAAVGTIADIDVQVDATRTVDVAQYFAEPDGEALVYDAASSNGQMATVSVSGSAVAVRAVAKGTVTVTVTASDPGGLTAEQAFQVTVPNRAPVTVGTIDDIEVQVDSSAVVDVAAHFDDPDGDALTYSAMSSSPANARVSVAGSVVTVGGVSKGTATVTVTAEDTEGLTAGQSFEVTVPNRAPVAVGTIDDIEVDMDTIADVNVAEHFDDPDGDALTYSAMSSSPAHASVSVSGSVVTVTGVLIGAATVTVTAEDTEGLGVTQTFAVKVTNPDRAVLDAIYDALGGSGWVADTNWMTDAPLEEWHGVTTDETGRVVRLDLRGNGLAGEIPAVVGRLRFLERLDLALNRVDVSPPGLVGDGGGPGGRGAVPMNDPPAAGASSAPAADAALSDVSEGITGRIPTALADLSRLEELWLAGNSLSGPVPSELGRLANLESLWLRDNLLTGSIPEELAELSRLDYLNLGENSLTGGIPSELTALSRLTSLWLHDNSLTGTIPPGVGELSNLEYLGLAFNSLTGTIPRQLGELGNLRYIWFSANSLTGAIPRELGELDSLEWLFLYDNDLSGTIPRELGGLSRLRQLSLPLNRLSGWIPPELGDLAKLEDLWLYANELTGAIPHDLVELSLTYFWWHDAGLCAPSDRTFQDWLRSIEYHRGGRNCPDPSPPDAYLVQAVQSREDPVPLVADKEALLRVFVTATRPTTETLPPATATFYVDDDETYSVEIDGTSEPIPTGIDEGWLDKSLNVTIPGSVIEEGLSVVVEIDPDSTIDADILTARRIPESGELDLEVEGVPDFELTAIPFLYTEDPDSSVIETVEEMADDEEDHELLHDTYDLLPIEEMGVDDHDPVEIDSNNSLTVLRRTRAIRAAEGGSGYWMGVMAKFAYWGGRAYRPGTSSVSVPNASTMAHELGHNLSLMHAPCGGPSSVDPLYPYRDGSIGAWGYDHRGDSVIDKDEAKDLMTYCRPEWVSDYHFEKAHQYRNAQEMSQGEARGRTGPSLLVWGARSPSGELSMDPALLVEGRSLLPEAPGDYTLTGLDEGQRELFSVSFEMDEPADAEEGTGIFVFLLPVEPGWEALASLVLAGPGDAAFTLDRDTEATMALIRDARSGQVRAIRGDFAERPSAPPGHLVRWSRGVPDREAWSAMTGRGTGAGP